MPSNDSRESTPQKSSGIENVYENSDHLKCVPGWQMPENGLYGIDFWSHMWRRPTETIVKWIKKYQIPFIGIEAGNSYIYASDFLSHIGKIQSDEAE
ncbi:hypothetical protein Enr17x_57610 [Gimesia fumaroli]|uniref:Uncharacterized protein n=2 Tax=Gimesia fumaroli TaxID=2527976 RepID=A0A518IKR7_9PLAN|nr:hypothetical protein Enr17x_57610 [Gimesia fumaroli]